MSIYPIPWLLAARLDWGLGNPNKTAALIAVLMAGVWVLPFVHRHLFWLALVLFTGLGICLLQTASRGGLVALLAGSGCVALYARRPWPRSHVAGLILAAWAIIGVGMWLQTTHRFGQGIADEDKSISHRLALWRVAPRMMVDAPNGWGFGNAGSAYVQWYQPLDRTETYRTLVNSHLTWLVELGWIQRFLYVFAWLGVLLLCWPGTSRPDERKSAWIAVALGIWVTFAISAWFSSVAESPGLWVVPAASLTGVMAWRWRAKRWPQQWSWIVLSCSACTVLLVFFVSGMLLSEQVRLHCTGSRIIVGETSNPEMWVVISAEVLGKNYGRTLRRYLSTVDSLPDRNVSIGFVNSADGLRPFDVQAKTLVITGTPDTTQLERLKLLVPSCGKLILLNPGFYPRDLETSSQPSDETEVITGEFSQVPASAWLEATKRPIQSVEGAGEFLPRWPELVLASHLTLR